MTTQIWVNIGPGNGLLPDGTKPLPEPILTNYQCGLTAGFPRGQWVKWSEIYILTHELIYVSPKEIHSTSVWWFYPIKSTNHITPGNVHSSPDMWYISRYHHLLKHENIFDIISFKVVWCKDVVYLNIDTYPDTIGKHNTLLWRHIGRDSVSNHQPKTRKDIMATAIRSLEALQDVTSTAFNTPLTVIPFLFQWNHLPSLTVYKVISLNIQTLLHSSQRIIATTNQFIAGLENWTNSLPYAAVINYLNIYHLVIRKSL